MRSISCDDIGIVIQGPTNHYDRVLNNIDYKFNYVWSTWNDEPSENLININKKIPIIVNSKPNFLGNRNINLQCISSEEGIKCLNTPFVIKVRGDLLWLNQKETIFKVFEDLIEKNSFCSFLNCKPSINEIHDFATFSTKENSLKLWSYREKSYTGLPPEVQLSKHLMNLFNCDYFEMINKMSFFNILLEENKFDLYCIKYDCNLSLLGNIDLFDIPSYPKKVK